MISLKVGGIILAAFIAGAFVASPELRAYAANTVGSSDIIDESILSQDIKNGEVKSADLGTSAVTNSKIASSAVTNSKIGSSAVSNSKLASNSVDGGKITDGTISAADLGPDSVGASEIKGVSKLIYAECTPPDIVIIQAHQDGVASCSISGVDSDDSIMVQLNRNQACDIVTEAEPFTDRVDLYLHNECDVAVGFGGNDDTHHPTGLIIWDK